MIRLPFTTFLSIILVYRIDELGKLLCLLKSRAHCRKRGRDLTAVNRAQRNYLFSYMHLTAAKFIERQSQDNFFCLYLLWTDKWYHSSLYRYVKRPLGTSVCRMDKFDNALSLRRKGSAILVREATEISKAGLSLFNCLSNCTWSPRVILQVFSVL